MTAVLRLGKHTDGGVENAMIMKRVLGLSRQHGSRANVVLRRDDHFSSTNLMELIVADGNTDFIFGLDCMGFRDCATYRQSVDVAKTSQVTS